MWYGNPTARHGHLASKQRRRCALSDWRSIGRREVRTMLSGSASRIAQSLMAVGACLYANLLSCRRTMSSAVLSSAVPSPAAGKGVRPSRRELGSRAAPLCAGFPTAAGNSSPARQRRRPCSASTACPVLRRGRRGARVHSSLGLAPRPAGHRAPAAARAAGRFLFSSESVAEGHPGEAAPRPSPPARHPSGPSRPPPPPPPRGRWQASRNGGGHVQGHVLPRVPSTPSQAPLRACHARAMLVRRQAVRPGV